MKPALTEKQWTAIVAVGWVLVVVHASQAHSSVVVPLSERGALEHIQQVRAADTAGPLFIPVSRTVCHEPHELVEGHLRTVTLDRPVSAVLADRLGGEGRQ